jgi:hypothetical protein
VFALPVYDRPWQKIWEVSAELTATGWQTSVVNLAAFIPVRVLVRLPRFGFTIDGASK